MQLLVCVRRGMLTTERSSSCAALPRVQHDLPHGTSSLEWWYHNAHITTTCGKEITLFSSFFRFVTGYNEETKTLEYGHGKWASLSRLLSACERSLTATVMVFSERRSAHVGHHRQGHQPALSVRAARLGRAGALQEETREAQP